MSEDKVLLVFPDATIKSLKMTPRTADSGYAISTTLTISAKLPFELAECMGCSALIYDGDQAARKGWSGASLTAFARSSEVSFFSPKETRKPNEKPKLKISGVELFSFSASDNYGAPEISFKIVIHDEGQDKAAAFLSKEKVYYGVIEARPQQFDLGLDDPDAADEGDDDQDGLFDGETPEVVDDKPPKKKVAKKKQNEPAAPKKKKAKK